ncbi:sulfate ABC transporter ATP-binding protein [Azospirillum sp. RWY-5-1]|uniref:Sulfate ABC transporter ATP-binding protein n=1 Tax=Azospirillum oleiclasticum TaxID=2735135 RepID=A0ABX2T3M0_9PROT|nr:sulfate ABC transporter ATP-binding protein [Azospirillum oleiclasticum]NYZ11511.1 sulfate ABC transporter ATP-binding protein [Azospirillum oleiclasticum]NYZ18672.1 sulfate ABC transporter ATP-binding protein [Azospirillum oleiclasticum]
MSIVLNGITKRFGNFLALDTVDLEVRAGELLALLGPSGSGKTTLLRIMAGLEFPDAGTLRMDGEDATDRKPRDRQVGFVFQHYALFRHMTVFDNIAFGLKVRPRGERPSATAIRAKVEQLLSLVQLEQFAGRYPTQLSGGQRQRVALARALAIEPKVLLLDEPFGALDAKVRKDLRRWLRGLHDEIHVTSVFVTHDQEEALELADRVAVMGHGRIEQIGTPTEVYDRPASAFVFDFLGNANKLEGVVEDGVARLPGNLSVAVRGRKPGRALAFIRPDDITLAHAPDGPARITAIHAIGPTARIDVDLDGTALEVALPRTGLETLALRTGDRCRVSLGQVHLF